MNLGLGKVYFCTGARNHELLNLFTAPIEFEYDERMASFKALGAAKVSKQPVGICTTSGTAVSECLSAMLEAYYSCLPLVLITGDRPKKLHGTGSPQTIDHEALTRSCRRSYFELTIDEFKKFEFKEALFPIHINVLVDDTKSHNLKIQNQIGLSGFSDFIHQHQKPLFLFSHENISIRPLIEKFKVLGLPFYAESLSQGHDLSNIKTEKKLLSLFNLNRFDSIVRIGHTPLSKLWRECEKKLIPCYSFDNRGMSGLSYGEVSSFGSSDLVYNQEFWKILNLISHEAFEDNSLKDLTKICEAYPQSELAFMNQIQLKLNVHDHVYLGNSLVVRFFELTQKKALTIYGNRGVNGIDGQLATALGIKSELPFKLFSIFGDLTAFYDLSSLRHIPEDFFIIIINNGGGRIFDMLKLDPRIVLSHENNFKRIAEAFNLSYSQKMDDFGKVKLLELFPDREESQRALKEWQS